MALRFLIGLVAAMAISPALATDLPREGTCHFAMKIEGRQTIDALYAGKSDGIASWDETDAPGDKDCGQTRWPPMKPAHCYGLSEFDGRLSLTSGYCVEADQDGDKIVWKIDSAAENETTLEISSTSHILMAGGKYAGISGKSKSRCAYSVSLPQYTAQCDVEETLRVPGKE